MGEGARAGSGRSPETSLPRKNVPPAGVCGSPAECGRFTRGGPYEVGVQTATPGGPDAESALVEEWATDTAGCVYCFCEGSKEDSSERYENIFA